MRAIGGGLSHSGKCLPSIILVETIPGGINGGDTALPRSQQEVKETQNWPTLASRLGDRHNALNLVRLVLASSVIVGHAWPLTGSQTQPSLEFISGIAVNGFFAASGYLIAGSRVRVSFLPYLWRRILRIFPGLIVCLLVTAFGFGPLASLIEGVPYRWDSALAFVHRNALLTIHQRGIEGTLSDVPYEGAWNGSLWTLIFEFIAYLILGILLSGAWTVRRARIIVPAFFTLVVVVRILALGPLDVTTNFYLNGLRLAGYFLAGSALYFFADRIVLRPWHTAAALVIYIGLWQVDAAEMFGQLPLAYLVLSIGAARWDGFTTKNDISYGVYIYAFPVQQTLVLLDTAKHGVMFNSVLTFAITWILAWASWRYVEKPSLALKRIQSFQQLIPSRDRLGK